MTTALSGIAIDAACRLTAGKAQYQTPTVVTSPQSPHVGPDFAGPFSTPEPGPNPTIEVKQEWTAMRIDARRDLLADVAIAVLDTVASFNPRTASGAREALAAIIAFKDRLIGLLEEGTWTISQDWSFDFKIEGSHCCVVQPTLMARAWKNDTYFRWDVRLETRLNGASAVAEDHSRDETRALSVIGLAPEPVFATTAQPGINTVTQSITANVRFQGYMDEFRDTLAALDRAVSFLGEQICRGLRFWSSCSPSYPGDPPVDSARRELLLRQPQHPDPEEAGESPPHRWTPPCRSPGSARSRSTTW